MIFDFETPNGGLELGNPAGLLLASMISVAPPQMSKRYESYFNKVPKEQSPSLEPEKLLWNFLPLGSST
jgi:hypothetical protein